MLCMLAWGKLILFIEDEKRAAREIKRSFVLVSDAVPAALAPVAPWAIDVRLGNWSGNPSALPQCLSSYWKSKESKLAPGHCSLTYRLIFTLKAREPTFLSLHL